MLLPTLALSALAVLLPAADEPLRVGMKAPDLSIEHFVKGEPVSAFEPGRVYVVEFWATWCAPCIKGMPHLSELQAKYADDLTIIGVSDEKLPKVTKWIGKTANSNKVHYTLATDPDGSMHSSYMAAARQQGIPCAFIVDREGIVQFIGHPATMDRALASVISGDDVAPSAGGELDLAHLAALKKVDGEHSPAAREQLDALEAFVSGGDYKLGFRARMVAPGAMQMGGGDPVDLAVVRTGTIIVSAEHGARIESEKSMQVPGMPADAMRETETAIVTSDRILLDRKTPMGMGAQGPMSIGRDAALERAEQAPMPVTARLMLDMNPVFANPLDVLAEVVSGSALDVAQSDEADMLVLEGKGAPFLVMNKNFEDTTPNHVALTLDATSHMPRKLRIRSDEVVLFELDFESEELPETMDPALFAMDEESLGDLGAVIDEQMEMMRAMSGGR